MKGASSSARGLVIFCGTLFWPLVIVGGVTGNTTPISCAMVLFFVGAAVAMTTAIKRHRLVTAERRRVWSTGVQGQARVISIGTDGGGLNGNPKVDFDLEVTLPGEPPYRAKVTSLVSKLAIPRIQPECEIAVRVDPEDRNGVLIDDELTPYAYG